MPASKEMPDTIKRSDAKARRTWSKAHDSAVETYGEGAIVPVEYASDTARCGTAALRAIGCRPSLDRAWICGAGSRIREVRTHEGRTGCPVVRQADRVAEFVHNDVLLDPCLGARHAQAGGIRFHVHPYLGPLSIQGHREIRRAMIREEHVTVIAAQRCG